MMLRAGVGLEYVSGDDMTEKGGGAPATLVEVA
jgi:hypothetical protein